jgi:hypothetical protein
MAPRAADKSLESSVTAEEGGSAISASPEDCRWRGLAGTERGFCA